MDNKTTGDQQSEELKVNERRLLKSFQSPWFTVAFAVFWTLVAIDDYRHHKFSWLDGFLLGTWGFLLLLELIAFGTRRRKD